jgi:hypothetical protein
MDRLLIKILEWIYDFWHESREIPYLCATFFYKAATSKLWQKQGNQVSLMPKPKSTPN